MSERFILAAKNFDEYNKFKGLDGFEVFEIEDIHGDFQGWIDDNLNGQEEVYLLVHFGQVSTETELCEKIESWKTRINKENVTILPISRGAHSQNAVELYEKVSAGKIHKAGDLKLFKEHWEEQCKTFSKKNKC